jgi:TRAP-type transport system periplasmic protein
MKKILVLSLAMILVISLFLAACASSTPPASTSAKAPISAGTSAAPASSAPSASSSAAGGKAIELKFAYHAATTADITSMGLEPWAREVEKATGNRVKLTSYPQQTLAKMADAYDATANGVTDLCWIFVGMMPGRFPLAEISGLPFLGLQDALAASLCLQHLYETFPEVRNEYATVKFLFATSEPPTPICSRSKAIRKLEDLSGLKFRVPGGPPTTWFKSANAVPISMGNNEVFENLQKGVLDGFTMPIHASTPYKLETITKYYTDARFNNSQLIMAANQKKWDSLPDDIKKAIESVSGTAGSKFIGIANDKSAAHSWQVVKDAGAEVITLSKEEQARWVDLAKPISRDFVATLDAKGLPGTKVLNEINKFVAEYK